ncbi:MAG: T9SS type A sorting domain-containing protein [bacterium]|nr:T9SS type A sorting domain-containing protein [bacterium]
MILLSRIHHYRVGAAVGVLLLLLSVLCPPPVMAVVMLNELLSSNVGPYMDEDEEFKDWIELYNTGPEDVELGGYGLSDDGAAPFQWIFPPLTLSAGDYLVVFASAKDRTGSILHTNFRLSANGDSLFLTEPGGLLIDLVPARSLPTSIALGKVPGDEAGLFYFDAPTPGAINDSPPYNGIASAPLILPEGIVQPTSGTITATITDPLGQATLTTWTLDGWDPTESSTAYTEPVQITTNSILRARNFEPGKLPSSIATRTYLFQESSSLPVVSMVTDPDNLWDIDTGIYVLGDDYEPSSPHHGANFWENWEKPAHLEFFSSAGISDFDLDLGIKIHGNMSRALPMKSLRLVMRAGYGQGTIGEQVFPDLDLDNFERLILRNAANDWCRAHLRDGFAQTAVRHLDLDCQAYRPVQVFLNGEYWGIHNLREHEKQQYLASHYGLEEEEVDVLEGDGTDNMVMVGDNIHYEALVDFLEANSLADAANYAYVCTQMEVVNFTLYNIAEIYFGNIDWPRNNRRYWRPRTPDGRWRWFMLDLDYSMGIQEDATFDNLAYATHPTGTSSQNPPWATLMIRRLLENEGFRRDFINSYADLLNTALSSERLLGRLQDSRETLSPDIVRHMTRWEYAPERWEFAMEDVQEYLAARPAYARAHIRQKFALPDTLTLSLGIEPPGSGAITLTAITIDEAWSGTYFTGNPIPLHAQAAPGFEFMGWSDPDLPRQPDIIINPIDALHITALFEASSSVASVAINEVNYNSADAHDSGDWIELWNRSSESLNISGWILRDENDAHSFTIPTGTTLAGNSGLVLCGDIASFASLFPTVSNAIGDLGFGFSGGGELLRLFDHLGQLHDSVEYGDSAPWPPQPDGNGPTLELIHPLRDNSLAVNWSASIAEAPYGTPGAINSVYNSTAAAVEIPTPLHLAAPWPNPFNPTTSITFGLDAEGPLQLAIYDIQGRLVRILEDRERHPAGFHSVEWHGRDRMGREVPGGVYLIRLQTPGGTICRKAVLVK